MSLPSLPQPRLPALVFVFLILGLLIGLKSAQVKNKIELNEIAIPANEAQPSDIVPMQSRLEQLELYLKQDAVLKNLYLIRERERIVIRFLGREVYPKSGQIVPQEEWIERIRYLSEVFEREHQAWIGLRVSVHGYSSFEDEQDRIESETQASGFERLAFERAAWMRQSLSSRVLVEVPLTAHSRHALGPAVEIWLEFPH